MICVPAAHRVWFERRRWLPGPPRDSDLWGTWRSAADAWCTPCPSHPPTPPPLTPPPLTPAPAPPPLIFAGCDAAAAAPRPRPARPRRRTIPVLVPVCLPACLPVSCRAVRVFPSLSLSLSLSLYLSISLSLSLRRASGQACPDDGRTTPRPSVTTPMPSSQGAFHLSYISPVSHFPKTPFLVFPHVSKVHVHPSTPVGPQTQQRAA